GRAACGPRICRQGARLHRRWSCGRFDRPRRQNLFFVLGALRTNAQVEQDRERDQDRCGQRHRECPFGRPVEVNRWATLNGLACIANDNAIELWRRLEVLRWIRALVDGALLGVTNGPRSGMTFTGTAGAGPDSNAVPSARRSFDTA